MGRTAELFSVMTKARAAYHATLRAFADEEGHRFRCAVYGSTRPMPGSPPYEEAYRLGLELARKHIDTVTGGGPGVMEGANKGARAGKENGTRSVGVRIEIPNEAPNGYLDQLFQTNDFPTRLEVFGSLSCCFICLVGGFGTNLEVAWVAQLLQLMRANGNGGTETVTSFMHPSVRLGYKPRLILVGERHYHYVRQMCNDFLQASTPTISRDDKYVFKIVSSIDKALAIVKAERRRWRKFLRRRDVEPLN